MSKVPQEIMIAQYHGIGPLSRGIRFFTRSKWSHSAVVLKWDDINYSLIEAWGSKGVVKVDGYDIFHVLSENHHHMTPVDLFEVRLPTPNIDFLLRQVGAKYDWSLIVKFLTRQSGTINQRWICSELVGEFCQLSGCPLQHMDTWKMAPEHVGISPVLRYLWQAKTI